MRRTSEAQPEPLGVSQVCCKEVNTWDGLKIFIKYMYDGPGGQGGPGAGKEGQNHAKEQNTISEDDGVQSHGLKYHGSADDSQI